MYIYVCVRVILQTVCMDVFVVILADIHGFLLSLSNSGKAKTYQFMLASFLPNTLQNNMLGKACPLWCRLTMQNYSHDLAMCKCLCVHFVCLPSQVAIKSIRKERITDDLERIHIQREIEITSSLRHYNIIRFHEGKTCFQRVTRGTKAFKGELCNRDNRDNTGNGHKSQLRG